METQMKDQKVTPVAAKPTEAAKPAIAVSSAAPAFKPAMQSPAASPAIAQEPVKAEAAKVDLPKPAPAPAKPAAPAVSAAPASEKKAVDTPAAKAPEKAAEKAAVKIVEKPATKTEAKPAGPKAAPAKRAAVKAAPAKAEPKAAAKPAEKLGTKSVPKAVAASAVKPVAVAKPAASKPVAAARAVAAAAPVAEKAKKAKAAKPARPALEEMIPEAPASAFSFPPAFNEKSLPRPETIAAPFARLMGIGADTARKSFEQAQETNGSMHQACLDSADAASRGMVELNTQILDLVRAQADATMGLWRSAMTAPSISEAVKVQTSGARQVYETTTAHLKVIAETTSRVVGETTRPIQAAINERAR